MEHWLYCRELRLASPKENLYTQELEINWFRVGIPNKQQQKKKCTDTYRRLPNTNYITIYPLSRQAIGSFNKKLLFEIKV